MPAAKAFRVLVATDGSTAARAALTTAVRFPWPSGARGSAVVAKETGVEFSPAVLVAALDHAADLTALRAQRSLATRWPDGQARVIEAEPVEAILREAKAVRADVIVLGWRGHGAVRRLLSGSVSRGVARRAPCSVLVVRRARRECRRVVIGLDASAHAARALELLTALTRPDGGHVTLLRAIDTMPVPAQALAPSGTRASVATEVARINDTRRAAAHKDLTRAAKVLEAAGWNVDQVVTEGAPLHDLLTVVAKTHADLVVVGARSATGLRHLLLGSVAEGAMNASPVPVLIVR